MECNVVLLNTDGTFPSPVPATQSGQYPKVGVTRDHQLLVTTSGSVPSSTNVAAFTEGTKTVTATGTPERLVATDTYVGSVVISPLRSNTGRAYVGVTLTDNTQTNEAPIVIAAPPGKSINLKLIYVDVTVNGEGVSYLTLS